MTLVEAIPQILLLERLGFGLILVETLFLLHFVVRFSRLGQPGSLAFSGVTAAFTLLVGGLLVFDPSLFSLPAGPTALSAVAIGLPRFAVLYIALGILGYRLTAHVSDIERREVRIIFTALSLYAGYTAGYLIWYYARRVAASAMQSTGTDLAFLGLFSVGTLYLLVLSHRLARRAPVLGQAGMGGFTWSPRVAILAPLILGLVTGGTWLVGLERVDLRGILRILAALLIAYGLLKFQIFGIDLKVKDGVRRSAVLFAFALVFFLVSEGTEMLISDRIGTWAGLGAAGLLTFGLRPMERQAQRIADGLMPGVQPTDAYLDKRRSEVYHAAVEQAAQDRVVDDRERRVLSTLATNLGLARTEAERIEQDVFSRAGLSPS